MMAKTISESNSRLGVTALSRRRSDFYKALLPFDSAALGIAVWQSLQLSAGT